MSQVNDLLCGTNMCCQHTLNLDIDRFSNDNNPIDTRLTIAARLLRDLEPQNEFVTDRLAILANLCGCSKRLDARKLSNRGLRFSTCALAMFLLNGELPCLIWT